MPHSLTIESHRPAVDRFANANRLRYNDYVVLNFNTGEMRLVFIKHSCLLTRKHE